MPLECSHDNHSKRDLEIYDSPENGTLETVLEHFYKHLAWRDLFRRDPEAAYRQSGLNYYQNEFAVNMLWLRAKYWHEKESFVES
jgi:hypothetical protein